MMLTTNGEVWSVHFMSSASMPNACVTSRPNADSAATCALTMRANTGSNARSSFSFTASMTLKHADVLLTAIASITNALRDIGMTFGRQTLLSTSSTTNPSVCLHTQSMTG